MPPKRRRVRTRRNVDSVETSKCLRASSRYFVARSKGLTNFARKHAAAAS